MTAGDHLVFDWAMVSAPWSADAFRSLIEQRERLFGQDRRPTLVLSNHDQPRQASRLAKSAGTDAVDPIAKAAAVLLLGLRGTPFLYYGEELGAIDVEIPTHEIVDPPARIASPEFPWWNRDQCRTPMAWSAEPGVGFTTGRPWLRIGEDAGRRNVEAELADPASVLSAYRRLLAARRAIPALRRGSYETLEGGVPDVFAWRRVAGPSRAVVAVNFAGADREITIPLPSEPRQIVGTHLEPAAPTADGRLRLRAFEGVIVAGG
jgi:alpha-glucosidase